MRAPEFWSDRDSPLARVLAPVGCLYGAATKRRLARPAKYRAPVPVICVGNVTAGGSGKTPVAQALVSRAVSRGVAVHCLTRGYGGRLPGPVRVDPATHTTEDIGDEPLLLAALVPTWVARDRAAGARAAVAAGAQMIVLDDGLQNPDVAYDLSLLVIDGGFGFGNARLIPAGPLREPVASAASRVGAAILIGNDSCNSIASLPAGLSVIRAQIVPRGDDLRGRNVVAFAGLGRPEKFHDTLVEAGAKVLRWFPFPDHHMFSQQELDHIAAQARDALLVTTEKDFVRLPAGFRDKVHAVGIDLVANDLRAFDGLLDRVLT